MKNILFFALFFCLCAPSLCAQANKRIDGNGKVITQTRSVGLFSSLIVDMPAEVEIISQNMPLLEITIDDNLLKYIEVQQQGNTLRLSKTAWIEPSRRTHIKVATAFVHYLETHGHGQYTMKGIDVPTLKIANTVADVILGGRCDELQISTTTGDIDATALVAQKATATTESNGQIALTVQQSLDAHLHGKGNILLSGQPPQIKREITGSGNIITAQDANGSTAPKTPTYIEIKFYNNSWRFPSVSFKGPTEKPFGYGTSFWPFQSKKETFPVGTTIYEVDDKGQTVLLMTLEAQHAGKTLHLFRK